MAGVIDPDLGNDNRGDRYAEAPYYTCPSRRINDGHRIHYVNNSFGFYRPANADDPPIVEPDGRGRPTASRRSLPGSTMYLTDFADDEGRHTGSHPVFLGIHSGRLDVLRRLP